MQMYGSGVRNGIMGRGRGGARTSGGRGGGVPHVPLGLKLKLFRVKGGEAKSHELEGKSGLIWLESRELKDAYNLKDPNSVIVCFMLICHRTSSDSSPDVVLKVDVNDDEKDQGGKCKSEVAAADNRRTRFDLLYYDLWSYFIRYRRDKIHSRNCLRGRWKQLKASIYKDIKSATGTETSMRHLHSFFSLRKELAAEFARTWGHLGYFLAIFTDKFGDDDASRKRRGRAVFLMARVYTFLFDVVERMAELQQLARRAWPSAPTRKSLPSTSTDSSTMLGTEYMLLSAKPVQIRRAWVLAFAKAIFENPTDWSPLKLDEQLVRLYHEQLWFETNRTRTWAGFLLCPTLAMLQSCLSSMFGSGRDDPVTLKMRISDLCNDITGDVSNALVGPLQPKGYADEYGDFAEHVRSFDHDNFTICVKQLVPSDNAAGGLLLCIIKLLWQRQFITLGRILWYGFLQYVDLGLDVSVVSLLA
jgi:hypothetical protein